LLWSSAAVSNVGAGVAQISYLWLAPTVTGSPVLIASIAAVQRFPSLLLSLPAGAITDRVDRR
jgi:hypothetical protein